MSVPGEVDGHERPIERERDGVPRVGVLRAAVEQDEFRCPRAPHERAEVAAVAHRRLDPADGWLPAPGDAVLLGILLEHRHLVVRDALEVGHAAILAAGVALIQNRDTRRSLACVATKLPKQCDVFAAGDPLATRHFAERGWVVTAPFDDDAGRIDPPCRRRNRGVARRGRGLAALPRAHRPRPAPLSHRELRAVSRRARRAAHRRTDDDLGVGVARRTGRAVQGEDQLQARRRCRIRTAPGRSGVSLRRRTRLVPDRSGWQRRSTTAASKWSRTCTTTCCPPTSGAASWPTWSPTLDWTPVEVQPGHAVWFHSLTPHRSGPNATERDRRALYPTYNARSAGDLRAAYYERKQAEFADGTARSRRSRVAHR